MNVVRRWPVPSAPSLIRILGASAADIMKSAAQGGLEPLANRGDAWSLLPSTDDAGVNAFKAESA